MKNLRLMTLREVGILLYLLVFAVSCNQKPSITPEEVRAIAKEAYIYANPMVDGYRIQYAYFVDKESPEYKAPWNTLTNIARVFTPDDKAVQTPNTDTPYGMLGMDLRSEPFVITLPPIEENRFYHVALIDMYTHNYAYIGTRITGNGGGNFMIAGPGWSGDTPKGIDKVLRCETLFSLGVFRTQLFNPADIENVKKIQSGYKVQPLSQFLGEEAPKAASVINYIKPLTPEEIKTSPEVFQQLNFVLGFCPVVPSEVELMNRFAKINIGAGKEFDFSKFSPEIQDAIKKGIEDAWAEFAQFKADKIDKGIVTSGDLFGTREYLKNNYLYRMAAGVLGIYGNIKEEAMYPFYAKDSEGNNLTGTNRYTLRFAPGQLPPVNAFWSITMYEMPQSLLVANPLNRYVLNSPMLDQFKKDADGGITFYIQNESPTADKENNWLPAPTGEFVVFMRLYLPKEEALNGTWKNPPITLVR